MVTLFNRTMIKTKGCYILNIKSTYRKKITVWTSRTYGSAIKAVIYYTRHSLEDRRITETY